jgi:hypothetical protein
VKKLFTLLFIPGALILGSSCKKYGCTDPDSANYDAKANENQACKYYLANGVAINNIAELNDSGSTWDQGSQPDLYAKIYASDNSVSYKSELVTDYLSHYLPTDDFKLTDKTWKLELWDSDAPNTDKMIFSGEFNPVKDGKDDKIPVKGEKADLTLQYFIFQEK